MAAATGCAAPQPLPSAEEWEDPSDPNVRAESTVTKSGTIAADEVWSGAILVRGEVFVPEGRTVTVEPNARILFATDSEPSSKIVVEGAFYAQGDFQRSVFFAADARTKAWHGVLFEPGSAGRVSYGQFQYETRLHIRSSAVGVTFSQFSDNTGAAVTVEAASPTVEDNVFRTNVVAVRCLRQASPDILNNTIIGNVYGVVAEDGSQPNIARNVIASNRQQGIVSQGASSPHVNSNNIVRNGGYAVQDGGRLSDNFIQGNNGTVPIAVDTSLSVNSAQLFGVEEVVSARSSPVPEAGDRRTR